MVPPCAAIKLGHSVTYGNHMKQWITQNNNFEQHDHATKLSLFTHFDIESLSSHMA